MITNLKPRNVIVQVTALSLGSMTLGHALTREKEKTICITGMSTGIR